MNPYGITPGSRVAVAMSGGVDSSVTALLLRDAGFDVFGVTMSLWSCHSSERARKQTCCSTIDVEDARKVCERLDMPHVVADFRSEFRERVIENFVGEYAKGRTPIPCVGCNQYFKFDRLWSFVRDEYQAEYIATGHYARIQRDAKGRAVSLMCGRDDQKDQTYYLFVMTQAQLQHSLFPLGELTKPEVRELAARYSLSTAEKPESFEICFVPDNDYAGFIEDHYPASAGKRGDFVDQSGNLLGKHHGTHAYTIGQRRGLGASFGERRYVTAIEPKTARVVLGDKKDLERSTLSATQMNWIGAVPGVGSVVHGQAKIRATQSVAPCRVEVGRNGCVDVQFDEPQCAITPGQAFVFYDGEHVRGGGWIDRDDAS